MMLQTAKPSICIFRSRGNEVQTDEELKHEFVGNFASRYGNKIKHKPSHTFHYDCERHLER